jgi:hypothetical protein
LLFALTRRYCHTVICEFGPALNEPVRSGASAVFWHAVGREVGFSLVRESPVASWTRVAWIPGCLDDAHWREWTIFVLEHASQASFLTGARAVGASREEESMDVLYERVAGLDVHTDTVVACVRIMADGTAKRECRTFSTTTEQ